MKYFPGSHRQIYKNLQEVNGFIDRSVEKHRETLDPSAPRDFIDCYLLRMEKVGFGRGNGGGVLLTCAGCRLDPVCPVPLGTRWPARGAPEPCGARGLPPGAAFSLLWTV